VYWFRNETMGVSGRLKYGAGGCTDVNAQLYFRTTGVPHTIEEHSREQFITRAYDENVEIGDDIKPAYLRPDLGYYVREITVLNNAGVELENYSVKAVFNSEVLIASGQMRQDCGDIRVTDENFSELKYWLKPGTCNTKRTVVWVRLPKIPPEGTKIHLHHGNLDLTSKSDGDSVFPEEDTFTGECSGSTPGGACTVRLSLGNRAFAEYQPEGYAELNAVMSGDFDRGGTYSAKNICNANSTWRKSAEFWLDGTHCLGTYSSGHRDCTDRVVPGWPVKVTELIANKNEITITADTSEYVNSDPGCGYYYRFKYSIRAKVRNYVEPEPTVIVPEKSKPDVAKTAVYISDALDTGETAATWGTISWDVR